MKIRDSVATTLWCPFSFNSPDSEISVGIFRCKTDDCMAWRDNTSEQDADKEKYTGYCALIYKDTDKG